MDSTSTGVNIFSLLFGIFHLIYWYLEALFRLFVPPSMKSIDGEVILVTGATGGIGKEICRYIVQCGVNIKLVLWDLNISELEILAGELKSKGKSGLQVFCYEVDISTRENIDNCCNLVKNDVGTVTIIFNNAGIAEFGNFLQLTNNQIEKTFQVNLLSHLWIIRQFLPEMVTLNHGRIINTCSVGGLMGSSHILPYVSSKFAVNGYTEALRAELALLKHDGVHCTTVYPYFVKTPIIKSLTLVKNNSSKLPSIFQQFMEPEDVARKIVDGMRRQYQYIYLPPIIPLLVVAEFLVPFKVRKHVLMSHATSFAFQDAEEQKKFKSPLVKRNVNSIGIGFENHVN